MTRPRNVLLCAAGVALLTVATFSAMHASSSPKLEDIQELIQKGDLAAAKARLSEFLRDFSGNAEALNLLGVVQAQRGEYRAAERSFQKAIAAAPVSVEIYLNLGRLYQENKDKDPEGARKGIAVYERVLRLDPSNNEANYQCALLLGMTGSYDQSLKLLSKLPETARQRPQTLALSIVDHAGLKDSQAEEIATRLLLHPELVQADVVTVLPMLLAEHNEKLAVQLLAGLEQRGLASAVVIHQLGLLYEQAGNLEPARATLEKEIQKTAVVTVPQLLALARIAYKERDYKGALGYLAHARDIAPQDAQVHFFFGMVCVEMDLQQEAYESLKTAVQLEPDNPYFNYVFGAVTMSRQDGREGYPYLKRYCELKPEDPRGHLALGEAYFYGHDFDLARRELKLVLNNPQTSSTAKLFLGRLANREENYAEAIAELQEAIRENPSLADAYAELGLAYRKRKQYVNAEDSLLKALQINPDNYAANLNLALVYELTKDRRAEEQRVRFNQLEEVRQHKEKEFLSMIEVRPY
jgi:tetratricopeptide (TPR) repeat protein